MLLCCLPLVLAEVLPSPLGLYSSFALDLSFFLLIILVLKVLYLYICLITND